MVEQIIQAAQTNSIELFLNLFFPKEWGGVIAKIIESGAEFSDEMCPWAPRWSKIPNTQKTGQNELEASLKTCLFKAHDCLHQLWGVPVPKTYDNDEYYSYKRSQMCGEVAVITISEFFLADYIRENCTEAFRYLDKRCALPMKYGPLKGKTMLEIAARMDGILHKNERPKWLRDHKESSKFADYYIPMLEADRIGIDHNWKLLKENNWIFPENIPSIKYSDNLDGLELTLWMVNDFLHLLKNHSTIDYSLANFNRERRKEIKFPEGWGM